MCIGTHPYIPAANTARVDLVYTQFGQTMMNVLYWQFSAQPGLGELTDLLNNIKDAWLTHIDVNTSNTASVTLLRATDLTVEDGVGVEIDPAASMIGARTSEAEPGNVTAAVKFSTGRTGRSFRGRLYHIGLTTDQVVGNGLTGTVPAEIKSGWENFFTAIAGLSPNPNHVIVSLCHNKAWRTVAEVTQVLSYSVDPNIDSQRRRLTGRGM